MRSHDIIHKHVISLDVPFNCAFYITLISSSNVISSADFIARVSPAFFPRKLDGYIFTIDIFTLLSRNVCQKSYDRAFIRTSGFTEIWLTHFRSDWYRRIEGNESLAPSAMRFLNWIVNCKTTRGTWEIFASRKSGSFAKRLAYIRPNPTTRPYCLYSRARGINDMLIVRFTSST